MSRPSDDDCGWTAATISAWSKYKVFPEASSIRNQTRLIFAEKERPWYVLPRIEMINAQLVPHTRDLLNPSTTTFVTVAPRRPIKIIPCLASGVAKGLLVLLSRRPCV